MKLTTKTNKDTNQELNQKCSNLQHSASGDQKHGTQPSVIPQIRLAKLALSGPQLLGELGCMGGCSVQASKGCRQEGFSFQQYGLCRQWLVEGNYALDAGVCAEEAKMQK